MNQMTMPQACSTLSDVEVLELWSEVTRNIEPARTNALLQGASAEGVVETRLSELGKEMSVRRLFESHTLL